MENHFIKLKTVAKRHDLSVAFAPSDYETRVVKSYNITRPSLQLVGFYNHFDNKRIQVIGNTEVDYLNTLPREEQLERLDRLFSERFPAMVLCHGVAPSAMLIDAARRYDVALLTCEIATSEFISQVLYTLRLFIAPRMEIHAVLVQVHGEGLLITGESGIGKSEVALELIKRGHRLVADDAVDIRRVSMTSLRGSAPRMIRYLMELRGVGIIDVRRLYGVGAVLPDCQIDMVVNFEHWKSDKEYDRLGVTEEYVSYLGVNLPIITVPVAPARNLAIILEVAAMNNRDRKLGHNTAQEFLAQHDRQIDSGWANDDDDDF